MRRIELVQDPNHTVSEHTSANQLENYLECNRYWGFEKLLGLKKKEKDTWLDLGSKLHWQLRCYMRGYTLDMSTEEGKRALAGLHLVPEPGSCEVIEDEADVNIDSRVLLPTHEPIVVKGARDLTVSRRGVWELLDYKTTRGDKKGDPSKGIKPNPWKYVKTPNELDNNIAGNIYAWDIMVNRHVDMVPGRWVYFLTDLQKHPDARATDVVYVRSKVENRVRLLLQVANEHREIAREFKRKPFDVNSLPPNSARCPKFGGCQFRAETGGPCNHIRNLGEMMTQSQQPMSIEQMLEQRRNGASNGAGAPPMGPPAGYAGPPPMAAPPPLAPPGPPMQQQGFPGLPVGGPQVASPAAPNPYPGYFQASDGQWYPHTAAPAAPAPIAAAAPAGYPPGFQMPPHAPHLPPEAYQPPQAPAMPQGAPMLATAPPAPQPQAPSMGAPAEPAKRGRPRKAGVKADEALATAQPGAPGGIPGSASDDLEPYPVDQRTVFMRACVLCVSSAVDLSAGREEIVKQSQNALLYADYCWQWLQATKA